MRFKNILKSRATIRKAKEYDFPEIEPFILEEGKKRDYEKQLLIKGKEGYYALYSREGKLRIVLLHSYDVFEEIKEKKYECVRCGSQIKSWESKINKIYCSCGGRGKNWREIKDEI